MVSKLAIMGGKQIETKVRVGDQLGRPHQLDATEEELAGALSFLDIQLYD